MNSAGLGYLIAFISMVAGAVSTFPFTDAARKWGPVAVNHFRLLVAFIVLSIVVMALDKKSPVSLFTFPSTTEYIYLVASGIMGLVMGDYFAFHCLAILGEKRYSILNTIAPGAALGFGFIMVGESINFIGLIGIAITIGGMIWFIQASNTKQIDEHIVHEYGKIRKGVLFGIFAGLCQGFQMTLAKKAIIGEPVSISPLHATWVRVLGAMTGYFIFTFITGRLKEKVIMPIRKEKSIILKIILSTIFLLLLSIVFVMWSLSLCKIAVAQTILSLTPIIAMPMAYFLYKEKMTIQTLFAGIVSIFGVYVLIWRDDIILFWSAHFH